jgi:hypothetical protein
MASPFTCVCGSCAGATVAGFKYLMPAERAAFAPLAGPHVARRQLRACILALATEGNAPNMAARAARLFPPSHWALERGPGCGSSSGSDVAIGIVATGTDAAGDRAAFACAADIVVVDDDDDNNDDKDDVNASCDTAVVVTVLVRESYSAAWLSGDGSGGGGAPVATIVPSPHSLAGSTDSDDDGGGARAAAVAAFSAVFGGRGAALCTVAVAMDGHAAARVARARRVVPGGLLRVPLTPELSAAADELLVAAMRRRYAREHRPETA